MENQTELRALTLWRPWPHAIFYGGKRVENRPWKPWQSVIGKLIALHAGMKYDQHGADQMREEGLYDPPVDAFCPKGCIVGIARITGYKEKSGLFADIEGENSDPWFFGLFGWKLEEITVFDSPIKCKGSQGLWPVTGETLDKVRAAYVKSLSNSAQPA